MDNDPSARLLQKPSAILYLSDCCGQKQGDQSSQKSTVFAQRFPGVLGKKEPIISVMVSVCFFKKQLSRQHFLGNSFKLCSKGNRAEPPPVQQWDGCVLCAHNVSLAGRLFFCSVHKNSVQMVRFSKASTVGQHGCSLKS